ncbi:glycoside hydrolase family 2 protein [Bacteroides clarus]|uniref:glycoside hydrolase family 2 protein n=1 Tax=Bacteroides clarus TaxID=626929 RepID=UPI003FEFAD31
MKKLITIIYQICCFVCVVQPAISGNKNTQIQIKPDVLLTDNWKIQSSQQINASGKEVSSPQFTTDDWYPTTLPATVMGVLSQYDKYKDIFIGTNYKNIDKSPFEQSWWYRKEFVLPPLEPNQHATLSFDGISYSANIWLNGTQIANRNSIRGAFRQFQIDITPFVKEKNILAVEVFKAQPGEPNIGFVDWNPRPADENMGIFREVHIALNNEVSINHTAIRSKVNLKTLDEAWLTVETELTNYSDKQVTGVLTGKLEGKTFNIPITLQPKEKRIEKISPSKTDILHLKNPRLWWCHNMGKPEMYQMELSFLINNKTSDKENIHFGIRDIQDYFTEEGHRGFFLNGKKVLVRSAGWTDDIFLRNSPKRNETELKYVRDMNLNSIRLENFWGTSQNLYNLCDKYGLLVLVGWSCHWEWEHYLGSPCDEFGGIKSETDMELIATSLKDQVLWLRNHPSIIAWFLGSDMLPRPELEKKYIAILSQIDNRPYICAAKELTSNVTGATGMKMAGPYDYVSPNYWYSPKAPGGAFGFNTETGIGAQLPVIESIKKMIPANQLWPINKTWDYHCTTATEAMNTLDVLKNSITARYGTPDNLDDFLKKADLLNYEGARAMFEAFRVNIPKATGIVQWMLNSAWPSFYWQLYDYYLIPTAAYYSVKKANMPQQLIYDYIQNKVYAVNEGADTCNIQASMSLYGIDNRLQNQQTKSLVIAPYNVVEVFKLPALSQNSFLFLNTKDTQKEYKADNFYYLATQPDQPDWDKTTWIRTPLKQTADFTQLSTMAKSNCKINAQFVPQGKDKVLQITLENTPQALAFFIRLSLKDEQEELISPIFWEDNYLTLAPGEKRTIQCLIPKSTVLSQNITLVMSGWNVPQQQVTITQSQK